jgi:hypothetical protein
MISYERTAAIQLAELQCRGRFGSVVAHSIAAVGLHYREVGGPQFDGRLDTRNEQTASADQLRHSRAVRAGWEGPLLAIK